MVCDDYIFGLGDCGHALGVIGLLSDKKVQITNTKWFDRLTVMSNVERLTTLSQVEGQITMTEI